MLDIAVLLPCYNEETAIGAVVKAFRKELPEAAIYVFDNNSTDQTKREAKKAGAIVRQERLQGKGHVVRRMFCDVEADIYIMADGDGTYDASAIHEMIDMLVDGNKDMVVGTRDGGADAYRPGHQFGNALFNKVVALLFGLRFTDIFSGYRVFSRRFVKSFPALSKGFDTETELTVHALEQNMPVGEVATKYSERAEGSVSKLNTFRDGFFILWRIVVLLKEKRPLLFFGLFFFFFLTLSLCFGFPVIQEYLKTSQVERLPSAILSVGNMVLAFLSLTCGLISSAVSRGRQEMKRMQYLSIPSIKSYSKDKT